jgi:hypothetical protein
VVVISACGAIAATANMIAATTAITSWANALSPMAKAGMAASRTIKRWKTIDKFENFARWDDGKED